MMAFWTLCIIALPGLLLVLFLGAMEWLVTKADKLLYHKYPRLFCELHPDIEAQKKAARRYGRRAG